MRGSGPCTAKGPRVWASVVDLWVGQSATVLDDVRFQNNISVYIIYCGGLFITLPDTRARAERERERERDRQTDRQTETENRERQRQRETATETETQRETETERDSDRDRDTERWLRNHGG